MDFSNFDYCGEIFFLVLLGILLASNDDGKTEVSFLEFCREVSAFGVSVFSFGFLL